MPDEVKDTTTVVEELKSGETATQDKDQSIDVGEQLEGVRREISNAMMGVVSEKERRIRELEGIITNQSKTTKEPEKPLDNDAFINDPNSVLARISNDVARQLKEQIAPLQSVVDELQTGAKFEKLSDTVRNSNPVYEEVFKHYGKEVRELALSSGKKPGDLTEQDIATAAMLIPGMIMTGRLQNKFANNGNTSTESKKVVPANIPPSNPSVRTVIDNTNSKMTDQERVVAKLLGRTDAEFVALRDSPSDMRLWPQNQTQEKK